MGSQGDSSRITLLFLTTLGLSLTIPTFHFISGVLYRRNRRPRQDGIGGDINKEDAEIEYSFLCG